MEKKHEDKGRGRMRPPAGPLTYVGDHGRGGTYVLRIRTREDDSYAFGSFAGGKIIGVPAGEYAYVGSALAEKGGSSLARRLVRHASRSGGRPPHAIRQAMLAEFPGLGLCDGDLQPGDGKTLKWNVDHLLDRDEAEQVSAILVRSPVPIEFAAADLLLADPAAAPLPGGRGRRAGDHPGGTHLLRVEADEDWWDGLPGRVAALLTASERPREAAERPRRTSRRPLRTAT